MLEKEKENNSNEKNLNIDYPILEKAGIRDWVLNHFYDLSVYANQKLSGVNIYHNVDHIWALEFFYDGVSTGLYMGKNCEDKHKSNFSIAEVKILDGEYLQKVFGSYNNDFIISLKFISSSGNIQGFFENSKNTNSFESNSKFFSFYKENSKINSLKFAFGKFLTFISPVFKDIRDKQITPIHQDSSDFPTLYISKQFGKFFDDTQTFVYGNEFFKYGRIKKITIFHDCSLVKGLIVDYEKLEVKYYHDISSSNIKSEILELDCNDEINFISVRCGDMIDNISICTKKGKNISAGGFGGGLEILDIKKLRKEFKNENLKFVGFTGGYLNNLHHTSFIFSG
jgi:hypothetical protein